MFVKARLRDDVSVAQATANLGAIMADLAAVTGMLLARGAARRREIAVRLASRCWCSRVFSPAARRG